MILLKLCGSLLVLEEDLVHLHGRELDFILLLSQEVLDLVVAGLEEAHPGSEVAVQESLVVLDPDLRVADHQVEIVVHKRPALLLLIQAVEPELVEVEQEGPLNFLVQLLLQRVLREDSNNSVSDCSDQEQDVGPVIDIGVEAFFVVEVLDVDLRGFLDGELSKLLNLLIQRLLAFVSDTAEDIPVKAFN